MPKEYSTLFTTLYDEQKPTESIGRGTHYSILRAKDKTSQQANAVFDFALIWDEDHDERVIEVLEELYEEGKLQNYIVVGERKAVFTAILATECSPETSVLPSEFSPSDDYWTASAYTLEEVGNGRLINTGEKEAKAYISAIMKKWKLGKKAGPQEHKEEAEDKDEKQDAKKFKEIDFNAFLNFEFKVKGGEAARIAKVDPVLYANGFIRGEATRDDNHSLLDCFFQHVCVYLKKNDMEDSISDLGKREDFFVHIKKTIGVNEDARLSINDDEEGLKIFTAIRNFFNQKLNLKFNFQMQIFQADNDGNLAIVDVSLLQDAIHVDDGIDVPVKIVYIDFNHYDPIFSEKDSAHVEVPEHVPLKKKRMTRKSTDLDTSSSTSSVSSSSSDTDESKPTKDRQEFNKDNIKAFYNMLHIDNLEFTLRNGILSRHRRDNLKPAGEVNIAEPAVMARRRLTTIPHKNKKGRKKKRSLHRFANLYLNAHNAMMAVVGKEYEYKICVLEISKEILKRGDVILTNQNASTDECVFFHADRWNLPKRSVHYLFRPESQTRQEWEAMEKGKQYGKIAGLFRTNKNEFDKKIKTLGLSKEAFFKSYEQIREANPTEPKQVRQAEALVRSKVKPRFITRILVPNEDIKGKVEAIVKLSDFKDLPVLVHPTLFLGYKSQYNLCPIDALPPLTKAQSRVLKGPDDYGYPSDLSDTDEEKEIETLSPKLKKTLTLGSSAGELSGSKTTASKDKGLQDRSQLTTQKHPIYSPLPTASSTAAGEERNQDTNSSVTPHSTLPQV